MEIHDGMKVIVCKLKRTGVYHRLIQTDEMHIPQFVQRTS